MLDSKLCNLPLALLAGSYPGCDYMNLCRKKCGVASVALHCLVQLAAWNILAFPSFNSAISQAGAAEVLKSELVLAGGLNLPVFGAAPQGDFDHLYIAEQRTARLLRLNLNTKIVEVVLDLPDPVLDGGAGDTGLNGFAFHPDFANNGKVYVQLSGNATGDIRVLEYTRSQSNPSVFDPATERQILGFSNPTFWHNGGWIGFGPHDGYLYIATGDGGTILPLPEQGLNSQDVNSIQGKILRIDVDGVDHYPEDDVFNYGIPETNPFAAGGGAPEIFALGLRHPFRNGFDRSTGDLYIADVGGSRFEEINFLPAGTSGGQNYGWRAREGYLDSPNWPDPSPADAIDPIHVYPHGATAAVIGGYVYRGNGITSLQGTYFFGDFVQKTLFSFQYADNQVTELVDRTQELISPMGSYGGIASFAEDAAGELYMLDRNLGRLYRIAARRFIEADFNASGVPGGLEQSTAGTAATFDGSTASFSGAGPAERSYLRTVDDDLHTTSFTADLRVTIQDAMVGFFGLGVGDPHIGFASEPRSGAHVFLRVDSDSLGGNASFVDGGNSVDPLSSGEAGNGTYVLRANYDAVTRKIQFVIGDDSTGQFVPRAAFNSLDTSDNGFNGTNARLFFGGADGIKFDDLSYRYFEGIDSLWTGTTDSSFATTTNWSHGTAPNNSSNLYFTDSAASFAVEVNGSQTIRSMTFSGNNPYSISGGTLALQTGDLTVVGSGEHNIGSDLTLLNSGTWYIGADAALNLQGALSDAFGGSDITVDGGGDLILDGATVGVGTLHVNGGRVIAKAGATTATGSLRLATDAASEASATLSHASTSWTTAVALIGESGHATLTVNAGADFAATNLVVGSSLGGSGRVVLTGEGTTLAATSVKLGHNGGSGEFNIVDGAAATVSDATTIGANSVLRIADGLANLGALNMDGGEILFESGSLSYGGDLRVGNGGLLGSDLVLASNRDLSLTGETKVDAFHSLVIDGAKFSTGSLVVHGSFQFDRGTVTITGNDGLAIGGAGPLGQNVTLAAGRKLVVSTTTTIEAASILAVTDDASFSSGTTDNYGTVVLRSPTATVAGTRFNNYGVLRGEGSFTTELVNQSPGEIRAEWGKLLVFSGPNNENQGRIIMTNGDLEFSHSLTNGPTGQILGRGHLYVGDTGLLNSGQLAFSNGVSSVWGDVKNVTNDPGRGVTVSGHAQVTFWGDFTHEGTSLLRVVNGSSVTFFGAYSGNGNISGGGDVYFEADLMPGSSPAEVTFDANLHFGTEAITRMEIGGTVAGLQYDRLNVSGRANLGGRLQVVTIGDFVPSPGDSFDFFNWTSVDGIFAAVELPALADDFMWNTQQLYQDGIVRVVIAGDYNADGKVDAGDYTVWRDLLGQTGAWLAADGDMNGQVDELDYAVWKQAFVAEHLGSGASLVAVPEPASIAMMLGLLNWLACRATFRQVSGNFRVVLA